MIDLLIQYKIGAYQVVGTPVCLIIYCYVQHCKAFSPADGGHQPAVVPIPLLAIHNQAAATTQTAQSAAPCGRHPVAYQWHQLGGDGPLGTLAGSLVGR